MQKYRVIVADSRSQGRSSDSGDSLSYEMMADDYAALPDAMKIDSAYIIGWSDGGIDTTAVIQDAINMVKPVYGYLQKKTNRNEPEKIMVKLFRLLLEEPHIKHSQVLPLDIA